MSHTSHVPRLAATAFPTFHLTSHRLLIPIVGTVRHQGTLSRRSTSFWILSKINLGNSTKWITPPLDTPRTWWTLRTFSCVSVSNPSLYRSFTSISVPFALVVVVTGTGSHNYSIVAPPTHRRSTTTAVTDISGTATHFTDMSNLQTPRSLPPLCSWMHAPNPPILSPSPHIFTSSPQLRLR